MIFSTYWFLAAAALFLPLYWLVRKPRLRLFVLLAFCVIFHGHFAGPAGVAPIIVLGLTTYFVGKTRNRVACISGIVLSVLALCFYKYTHFLMLTALAPINPWLGSTADTAASQWIPGAPPLAISFFVFEFVHYLVEILKGGEPIGKLTEFAQFALYFPSLVAGPIKRYSQFIPALHEGVKHVTMKDAAVGLSRVAAGYFKKAVIADNLALVIDFYAPKFSTLLMWQRWLLLVAIAMRIYMDFSGYSDMAIGFSQMMGITLPPNFNWPYIARNIQDFWQRWHISLSTWIRDYVYIPLGGSRQGTPRRITNGIIAFAVCGLWHGAAWNFMVWGIYHGLGLAICSSYRTALGPLGLALGRIFDRVPAASWALTMVFVSLGWLLFFYPLSDAWLMTRLLFVQTV